MAVIISAENFTNIWGAVVVLCPEENYVHY